MTKGAQRCFRCHSVPPGSVFGFSLAGSTLLAIHYGKSGWGRLHRLHPKTLAPIAAPMRVGHEPRAVV